MSGYGIKPKATQSGMPVPSKPKRRKMHTAMIIWGVIVLIWLVAGIANSSSECSNQADELSSNACAAGAGIGIALVLFIGIAVMGLLALISLATRPAVRPCPRCGNKVRAGYMNCWSCGFDFSTIGQPPAGPTGGGTP